MAKTTPQNNGTVFVTVGTTKFDELIEAVDTPELISALIRRGYRRLLIQKGNGTYVPCRTVPMGKVQHTTGDGFSIEYFDYAPSLLDLISTAALVISHAGSGSIFETLTVNRPLVVVPNPRLMDNHQVELGEHLSAMGHLVCATPQGLADAVLRMEGTRLTPYQKGSAQGIVRGIDALMGRASA